MPSIVRKLRARLTPRWLFDRLADAAARDDTRGFVELSELGLADENRVFYDPSDRFALGRLLRRLEVRPGAAFLDYGAGKGRAVLAAARQPFGRVIGIDVSPDLIAAARANVARLDGRLRCRDVVLEVADAARFEVPDDVGVAYLYCPFTGPVFAAAIERLLESVDRAPRPLALVYMVPFEHNHLLATGRVRPIDSAPSRWPAWRLGAGDAVVIYAIRPDDGGFPDAAALIRDASFHDPRWRSFADPHVRLGERFEGVRPLVEPPPAGSGAG